MAGKRNDKRKATEAFFIQQFSIRLSGCDRILSKENPAGYNANNQQHDPESVVTIDWHFFDRRKARPLETYSIYPIFGRGGCE